jgi:hypothetical protein
MPGKTDCSTYLQVPSEANGFYVYTAKFPPPPLLSTLSFFKYLWKNFNMAWIFGFRITWVKTSQLVMEYLKPRLYFNPR